MAPHCVVLPAPGYAEAIQSQKLLDAIASGSHGAIALSYVEWAGEGEQMIVVDWAVIRNAADGRAFAAALSGAPRSFVGRTAIGSAINFAFALFSEAKFAADRRVIAVPCVLVPGPGGSRGVGFRAGSASSA